MKCCGTVFIGALGWLGLQMSAHAIAANPVGRPYQSIVERNVFRLRPPSVHAVEKSTPLPPITLQGIACFSWRRQALFKVFTAAKAGERAREIPVVLEEGGRVGEIEVVEINARTATVRFRNQGQEQTLYLDGSPAKGGAD